MIIEKFTFNPFQENTYVVYNDSKECVIIDPGCYEEFEFNQLTNFIENNQLTVKHLLNTHCHIDHILGNYKVSKKYNVLPEIHKEDLETMTAVDSYAHVYGFNNYQTSPIPSSFLDEDAVITLGDESFEIRFTPGHCRGHIVFISHKDKFVINGDVLFQGSIGRTDLPGGDFDTLSESIKSKMYTLPDDYLVYCGHGPETTIGNEKKNNPFVKG